jgi:hypothetical protein
MVKSTKMRWAWHVARMGERIVAYRVLVRKLDTNDHLKDLGVDGSM